ncbi:hypothetical protein MIB92_07930 [Aestuariirhabdus sp. Z084]|uniref:hypothetical protein n=1 Tax=Aestuariirhabdus haliotis TaxID=2918751 RepID=UPI00201B39FE|nr:hypothetical protein [Aestuariirhabdus haliotis]MCL6415575.1 hypothetical protein [Aestuariirhabdus haliotis]MCL6419220.1 hypothetical protein [Aestuariirhabdus haliotis]
MTNTPNNTTTPMTGAINKQQWSELFADTGLTEAMMQQWHQLFEQRHPEGHESFLRWLGESSDEVARIRQWSRDSRKG